MSLSRWLATSPDDTREVLVGELARLGASALRTVGGGVAFEADLATAYRAHLALRTASRIQRIVATIPVARLAEAAREVPWTTWLPPGRPFAVRPHLGDALAASLGEDTVADALTAVIRAVGPAPGDPSDRRTVSVVAHVRGGVCTLGVDTAGAALHQRGWRVPGHPAVLKETLAAAILAFAGYDGTEPLLDPMCGSGTLLVEAAYVALNKGPLVHRKRGGFALEHLADFDRALWRRIGEEVRAQRLPEPPASISGGDVRADYVEVARATALRARVERHLTLEATRFQDRRPPAPTGLVVANLPYGERIGRGTVPVLVGDVGRTLRERYAGWRAALLVPASVPPGAFGLRVAKVIHLRNGALPVQLVLTAR